MWGAKLRHVHASRGNFHARKVGRALYRINFKFAIFQAHSGPWPYFLAALRFKNFSTKFWWWEPILMNFGDFDIDFKILKKSCKDCYPILGPILENFDFRIWVKSQSYDKPPWRNFVFLFQIWIFSWKIENLKSLTLAQIQIFGP